MSTSPNLSFGYLDTAATPDHITHNEALCVLDATVQASVINATSTAPPTSPSEGDTYIVAATATGAWAEQENTLAAYQGASWNFITPQNGWRVYDTALSSLLVYNGGSWESLINANSTKTVEASGEGMAFVDSLGGVFGRIATESVRFSGLEASETGTSRLGFLEISKQESQPDEILETDALGGILSAVRGDEVYSGGQYTAPYYTINRNGDLLNSAPLQAWGGPGVNDTPLSETVAATEPVTFLRCYRFPKLTSNRYYRSGFDLAIMEAPKIPAIAAWPSGRIIRVNSGKSGVAQGVTGEGNGSHIRISVRQGDKWRPVWFIVPNSFDTEAVVDVFIRRLPDNRAIITFPHKEFEDEEYGTAIILENPEDDPSNWVFGDFHNIGRGFPGLITTLDNGDIVGTVGMHQIGVSASDGYSPNFGNRFGYYTMGDDNSVSFTHIGTIPPVEPGADFNKWQETSIVQIGPNALFAMFRTIQGYYYSISTDRGQNWVNPQPFTTFPTIDAKAYMQRMPDGRLLAIANATDNAARRRDLTLYLSEIGASPLDSFPYSWRVDARTWTTYPQADWIPDTQGLYRGEIALVYDRGRNGIPDDQGGYLASLLFSRFNIHALHKGFTNFSIEELRL